MSYKNTATVVCIRAIDTVTGLGKTGDGGNFTIRGVGDGAEYTPGTPAIAEIDATNLPGIYSISLSTSENNYTRNLVSGKSSTVGIILIPYQWENETSVAGDASVTAIKVSTDKLLFDGSSYVKSVQQYPTGAVVADADNGSSNFKTNLTDAVDDTWKEVWIQFTSGTLTKEVRKVTGYNGTTKFITVSLPFTATPAGTDAFKLINQ